MKLSTLSMPCRSMWRAMREPWLANLSIHAVGVVGGHRRLDHRPRGVEVGRAEEEVVLEEVDVAETCAITSFWSVSELPSSR
jgi:hypothetical protein